MIAAQQLLGVGGDALEQQDGLIYPPALVIGDGEIVPGQHGAWVGFAEQPLTVGESAFLQPDGFFQPPGSLVGAGEA